MVKIRGGANLLGEGVELTQTEEDIFASFPQGMSTLRDDANNPTYSLTEARVGYRMPKCEGRT